MSNAPSFPPAAQAEASAGPSRRAFHWALVASMAFVALLLRCYSLGAKSVWLDEGISIAIAQLRWPQFVQVLWQREANMALYYFLLHFWIKVGSSESFVRALSVVFSVATVPLLYALGARLFGRRAGLVAAWLLAINAYHIRYAQEARSYALVVFLAVLATWMLARNIGRPDAGWSFSGWGLYCFVAALAVYAHFFGALVVAAHGVSLAWLARGTIPWRKFLRSLSWIGLLILPIAAVVLRIGDSSAAWLRFPGWRDLLSFFESTAGNRGISLLILEAVALTVATVAAWRQWRESGRGLQSWSYALIFAWLVAPLGIVLAVSAVRPIFLSRYLIFCLPALLLGVAVGIARLRPAPVAWALCAALSVLSMQGTLSYYRHDFDIAREDWRSASNYILDHARHGDGIFFSTFGRMPYEYYKSQRSATTEAPQIVNWPGGDAFEPEDFVVRPVAEMLRDARPAPNRIWLVLFLDHTASGQVNPTSVMLRAWYRKDRKLIAEREFPQITVLLFARDEPGDELTASRP